MYFFAYIIQNMMYCVLLPVVSPKKCSIRGDMVQVRRLYSSVYFLRLTHWAQYISSSVIWAESSNLLERFSNEPRSRGKDELFECINYSLFVPLLLENAPNYGKRKQHPANQKDQVSLASNAELESHRNRYTETVKTMVEEHTAWVCPPPSEEKKSIFYLNRCRFWSMTFNQQWLRDGSGGGSSKASHRNFQKANLRTYLFTRSWRLSI